MNVYAPHRPGGAARKSPASNRVKLEAQLNSAKTATVRRAMRQKVAAQTVPSDVRTRLRIGSSHISSATQGTNYQVRLGIHDRLGDTGMREYDKCLQLRRSEAVARALPLDPDKQWYSDSTAVVKLLLEHPERSSGLAYTFVNQLTREEQKDVAFVRQTRAISRERDPRKILEGASRLWSDYALRSAYAPDMGFRETRNEAAASVWADFASGVEGDLHSQSWTKLEYCVDECAYTLQSLALGPMLRFLSSPAYKRWSADFEAGDRHHNRKKQPPPESGGEDSPGQKLEDFSNVVNIAAYSKKDGVFKRLYKAMASLDKRSPKTAEEWLGLLASYSEDYPLCCVASDVATPGAPMVCVNKEFCQVTGFSSREALGRSCRFLQGPDTEAEAVEILRKTLSKGEASHVLMTNYRKNQEPFLNLLTMRPVFDLLGHYRYVIAAQFEVEPEARVPPSVHRRRLVRLGRFLQQLPSRLPYASAATATQLSLRSVLRLTQEESTGLESVEVLCGEDYTKAREESMAQDDHDGLAQSQENMRDFDVWLTRCAWLTSAVTDLHEKPGILARRIEHLVEAADWAPNNNKNLSALPDLGEKTQQDDEPMLLSMVHAHRSLLETHRALSSSFNSNTARNLWRKSSRTTLSLIILVCPDILMVNAQALLAQEEAKQRPLVGGRRESRLGSVPAGNKAAAAAAGGILKAAVDGFRRAALYHAKSTNSPTTDKSKTASSRVVINNNNAPPWSSWLATEAPVKEEETRNGKRLWDFARQATVRKLPQQEVEIKIAKLSGSFKRPSEEDFTPPKDDDDLYNNENNNSEDEDVNRSSRNSITTNIATSKFASRQETAELRRGLVEGVVHCVENKHQRQLLRILELARLSIGEALKTGILEPMLDLPEGYEQLAKIRDAKLFAANESSSSTTENNTGADGGVSPSRSRSGLLAMGSTTGMTAPAAAALNASNALNSAMPVDACSFADSLPFLGEALGGEIGLAVSDLRAPGLPLIYTSRGFEKLTGYSNEFAVGRNCRFLQGKNSQSYLAEELAASIRTYTPSVTKLTNYDAMKRQFQCLVVMVPVRTRKAHHWGYVVAVQTEICSEDRDLEYGPLSRRLLTMHTFIQALPKSCAYQQRHFKPPSTSVTGVLDAWLGLDAMGASVACAAAVCGAPTGKNKKNAQIFPTTLGEIRSPRCAAALEVLLGCPESRRSLLKLAMGRSSILGYRLLNMIVEVDSVTAVTNGPERYTLLKTKLMKYACNDLFYFSPIEITVGTMDQASMAAAYGMVKKSRDQLYDVTAKIISPLFDEAAVAYREAATTAGVKHAPPMCGVVLNNKKDHARHASPAVEDEFENTHLEQNAKLRKIKLAEYKDVLLATAQALLLGPSFESVDPAQNHDWRHLESLPVPCCILGRPQQQDRSAVIILHANTAMHDLLKRRDLTVDDLDDLLPKSAFEAASTRRATSAVLLDSTVSVLAPCCVCAQPIMANNSATTAILICGVGDGATSQSTQEDAFSAAALTTVWRTTTNNKNNWGRHQPAHHKKQGFQARFGGQELLLQSTTLSGRAVLGENTLLLGHAHRPRLTVDSDDDGSFGSGSNLNSPLMGRRSRDSSVRTEEDADFFEREEKRLLVKADSILLRQFEDEGEPAGEEEEEHGRRRRKEEDTALNWKGHNFPNSSVSKIVIKQQSGGKKGKFRGRRRAAKDDASDCASKTSNTKGSSGVALLGTPSVLPSSAGGPKEWSKMELEQKRRRLHDAILALPPVEEPAPPARRPPQPVDPEKIRRCKARVLAAFDDFKEAHKASAEARCNAECEVQEMTTRLAWADEHALRTQSSELAELDSKHLTEVQRFVDRLAEARLNQLATATTNTNTNTTEEEPPVADPTTALVTRPPTPTEQTAPEAPAASLAAVSFYSSSNKQQQLQGSLKKKPQLWVQCNCHVPYTCRHNRACLTAESTTTQGGPGSMLEVAAAKSDLKSADVLLAGMQRARECIVAKQLRELQNMRSQHAVARSVLRTKIDGYLRKADHTLAGAEARLHRARNLNPKLEESLRPFLDSLADQRAKLTRGDAVLAATASRSPPATASSSSSRAGGVTLRSRQHLDQLEQQGRPRPSGISSLPIGGSPPKAPPYISQKQTFRNFSTP